MLSHQGAPQVCRLPDTPYQLEGVDDVTVPGGWTCHLTCSGPPTTMTLACRADKARGNSLASASKADKDNMNSKEGKDAGSCPASLAWRELDEALFFNFGCQ